MKNLKHFSTQSVYWLKVISLGLILGLGIQFAEAWTNPTLPPPGGNVSGPITTGAGNQVKSASLGLVGNLVVTGIAKIGSSVAACDATLAGAIRWTGSAFEGCDGSGSWKTFGGVGIGATGQASFTSSANFQVPAGVTSIKVMVWGAGGGGGCGISHIYGPGGAGGGGGGYSEKTISVTPGTNYSVTVGVGGAGGVCAQAGDDITGIYDTIGDGTNGGITSFSSIISCTPGKGAHGVSSYGLGIGGTCTGGSINFSGQNGTYYKGGNGSSVSGIGTGGAGGTGGLAGYYNGSNGSNYGGGGGGLDGIPTYGGGAGGPGHVLIEW